ncbi:MAG TPA: TetR/AcrR family transcriptional regulator [Holophaga sp.]|nr:TetR/AcrR family transcriptional regulator [Holophaga sp.]
MCPRPPESSGTRKALLEAALFCFSERGYEGTSLRMVAERAGKNTSLIAHHFGSKEELYLAVFKDMLEERRACQYVGATASLEELQGHPDRAAALLRDVIVWHFKVMRSKFESTDPKVMAYARLWHSAMRMPIPELEPMMRECLTPLRMQIAACIQALRPDLPAQEIPFWCALVYGQGLANTMLHSFNQLVFGPECYPESAEHMAEQIADITLRAIGRPENPPPCLEHA